MNETYEGDDPIDLSVVMPCYNEEEAVAGVIAEVRDALRDWAGLWEIIIVDDASTDRSAELAESAGVRVLRRPERYGAGAARKVGIAEARGKWVAMLDADGSYVPAHLPELLSHLPAYDQVNGARTSEKGSLRPLRFLVKWSIRKLAEWIIGRRIPDLNTGMKVFKRDVMEAYTWVLPDGFSCVSAMTLAFMANNHPVRYVDVDYRERIGRSKFHPVADTLRYCDTVLRMIMYFRPLRIFLPASGILFLTALVKGYYDWGIHEAHTLQESDIILALSALGMLTLGLLADLIVAHRRGGR